MAVQHALDTLNWLWERRRILYWQEQGKIAADHGVTPRFEMQVADLLHNLPKMQRFAQEIGPVVACNFDISHLWAQSIDPIKALRYLGTLVRHVHPKDAYVNSHIVRWRDMNDTISAREPGQRSWMFSQPGWGHDASVWRKFFKTLRFIGYDDILSMRWSTSILRWKRPSRKRSNSSSQSCLSRPLNPSGGNTLVGTRVISERSNNDDCSA